MERSDINVIPADTAWLNSSGIRSVCEAVSAEGAQIYFVGGCVRDAILGVRGSDVDMATDATPQEVTRLAQARGLKVVPTGIDHGTVTVVAQGVGYEITTFRKDVKTDGRHAEVVFAKDIAQDAARRDFTLNALYATPQGKIVDPLGGGINDCVARRITFIDDAGARIREDYLRILRFFRFHAWYGDPHQGFDTDALDAIAQNNDGLKILSKERVGAEIHKLLAAPEPAPAIATMQQTGVLQQVLPGSDMTMLGPVIHLESNLNLSPNWLYRLAALGGEGVSARLRLSKKETKALEQLRSGLSDMTPIAEIAYRQGIEISTGALILRAVLANQPLDSTALLPLQSASRERFPLTAKDLMPALSGKALGDRLAVLERAWLASDFRLTSEELMALK